MQADRSSDAQARPAAPQGSQGAGATASISIRELTATDAPAFAALRRLVVADSPVQMGLTLDEELQRPSSEFEEQLSAPAPSVVFGAFDGEALVATAGISRPTTRPSGAHKAVLWGVFTAPTHRRRSLARQLSELALARAFSAWAERVYLYVFLPNDAAVRLYESLGFVATGREPGVLRIGDAFHDIQSMSRARTPPLTTRTAAPGAGPPACTAPSGH